MLPGDETKKEVAAAGRSAEEVSAEAWGNYLQRDRSVVVDTFQGQLKSSVRCKDCGFTNTKFDPFMYLSLPLPKAATTGAASSLELAHCLEEFMAEETLAQANSMVFIVMAHAVTVSTVMTQIVMAQDSHDPPPSDRR